MLVINRSAPPDVLDDVSCADTMFSILEAAFGFGFWLQVWFVKVVQTAREVLWFLGFGLLCRHTASNSITTEMHTSGVQ